MDKTIEELKEIIKILESYINNTLRIDSDTTAKAVKAATEVCALICEEISTKHWVDYKRGKNRADLHYQGLSMGAEECEDAIRARNK